MIRVAVEHSREDGLRFAVDHARQDGSYYTGVSRSPLWLVRQLVRAARRTL